MYLRAVREFYIDLFHYKIFVYLESVNYINWSQNIYTCNEKLLQLSKRSTFKAYKRNLSRLLL
jgi:hypothetical protein